ncbi:predicted protein [Saccharomyces cerevisiae RM11-1a]|uniref:Uncharacterized protein YPR159C-A n=3 Tax=Saccharomyces cerevisiae TaxID=4932 RepID=YP159_YEAST|nr:uncharacterized protein YPR159C-A [Saccharomyces cerevisiae S288C]Q8TGQ7.1 RecName: Full=Uncharacterized protein YPR159C-A [Saccharomyces cerevisiae S288C]AAL79244.1 unknown [Saccharomyces cerevisiae]AHY78313.1 hypothetical protein H779_YJM993P00433 [Saccharomyces cerevisiae YJM993]AJP42281.1 hypothetical protein F842_YJM1078P00433 [Saccharomyces cerevisiae YJM1078]AJV91807.1 hypothetical protein H826_YJM1463P00429 [Saccharomyces cerevisiae YJM1463]AJV92249.1 hypothetical protein H827_YJM1|eukprot:NP_878184.1 hypothetical protein YPR159C-A [Saccharomyces cerevisiae S288C]
MATLDFTTKPLALVIYMSVVLLLMVGVPLLFSS